MGIILRARIDNHCWLALGMVITLYCLINLALPHLPVSGTIKAYAIRPILWGLLAWSIFILPRYRPTAKLKVRSAIIQLALAIGFFQVLLYAIGGLLSSFGKSPSSFTPMGILTNLFFVTAMLAGMELSRAWLVNRIGKHHTFLALAFVGLLYTMLGMMPVSSLTVMAGGWSSGR